MEALLSYDIYEFIFLCLIVFVVNIIIIELSFFIAGKYNEKKAEDENLN